MGRAARSGHHEHPDFKSLTVLPWRKNMAWVPGNLHVNGQAWPYCPRTILTQRARSGRKALGYTLNVGVEPEFMLPKKNAAGGYDPGIRWIRSANPATTCARSTAISM